MNVFTRRFPQLRHPLARRLTRVLGWLILSVTLLLAALASVVQFWLLPRLPQFKPELAARLGVDGDARLGHVARELERI